MNGLLPCARAGNCQADAVCHRPPRFQVQLNTTPRAHQPTIPRWSDACASHLVAMVNAMTAWAREHQLTDGDLAVLAVDPPAGGYRFARRSHRDCTETNGLLISIIPLST